MTKAVSNRLEASRIDIRYGASTVLQAADLSIRGGGFHLLVGRNGAGKSSLLRAMAGLQALQGGAIVLNGSDVHAMSSAARAQSLAFVASTPPRTSQLRVGEVLSLAASKADRVMEVLAQYGELAWAQQRMDALSDGQAQRVMFARAVLQGTPWIFMDEPTAFLDVPSRRAFWTHAVQVAEQGTTLVLATHDYEQLAGEVEPASVHLIEAMKVVALDPKESPSHWTQRMDR
jgi:ABC-type cobalamin/Fe3+-siderophores transport system ATPase subunit